MPPEAPKMITFELSVFGLFMSSPCGCVQARYSLAVTNAKTSQASCLDTLLD